MKRTLAALIIAAVQVSITSACASSAPKIAQAGVAAESPAAAPADRGKRDTVVAAEQSEPVRALLAAIELAKGNPHVRGPILLSPVVARPGSGRHDSTTLAAVSRSFVRIIDPVGPEVLDTLVLSFMVPVRQSDGYVAFVEISGAYRRPNGCIARSAQHSQILVRCAMGACTPEFLSRVAGDGFCRQENRQSSVYR